MAEIASRFHHSNAVYMSNIDNRFHRDMVAEKYCL